MNTVMAACTGIQNRCSGTPVPRWMIAKDDGGEALQIGTTTMCSKSPSPKAAAIEKQRKTNDHSATFTFIGPSFGARLLPLQCCHQHAWAHAAIMRRPLRWS